MRAALDMLEASVVALRRADAAAQTTIAHLQAVVPLDVPRDCDDNAAVIAIVQHAIATQNQLHSAIRVLRESNVDLTTVLSSMVDECLKGEMEDAQKAIADIQLAADGS